MAKLITGILYQQVAIANEKFLCQGEKATSEQGGAESRAIIRKINLAMVCRQNESRETYKWSK